MIALDAIHRARHDVGHELLCLFKHVVGVDQNLADFGMEIVANRADDQTRFLINQEGAALRFGCAINRTPELQQVIQIPLQFFGIATDTGRARNQAHAAGYVEAIHHLAQFLPVFAFDAA